MMILSNIFLLFCYNKNIVPDDTQLGKDPDFLCYRCSDPKIFFNYHKTSLSL